MRTSRLLLGLAAVLLPTPARAADRALKVFPPAVELRGQDDRTGVVVQLVDAQGTTTDVTAAAKLRVADPGVAALTGQALTPKADGSTKLLVEHVGLTVEVPVVV